MEKSLIIISILEFLAIVLLLYGIYNEEKLIDFEQKIKQKFIRGKEKEKKQKRTYTYPNFQEFFENSEKSETEIWLDIFAKEAEEHEHAFHNFKTDW